MHAGLHKQSLSCPYLNCESIIQLKASHLLLRAKVLFRISYAMDSQPFDSSEKFRIQNWKVIISFVSFLKALSA